jgi:alpha-1,3-rhamnosyl/mannosyltransferase
MNVAFDASAVLGRSGIERYSREVIRALTALDQGVVATLIGSKDSTAALEGYFGRSESIDVRAVLSHERALGAPLRRLMRVVQRRQWDAAAANVDLVHILGPQKVLPHKRPLVVTIHDLFPMYDAMGIEGTLKSKFPRRIARQLRAASAVMCPSAYVASTIRKHFPWYTGPIHVTPLAAGDDFTRTPMTESVQTRFGIERPYLLFIGRLDGRKNLDRMLDAWNMLPAGVRSAVNFVLVIAGGDDAIERFRTARLQKFQDGSVRILKDVATSEIVQLLSSARALAFATLGEGFGLPVIEAMKCGCPVITSSTTSLPEVGGDAALYVDPMSVDDIASAMQRCIDDDELVSMMRERGLVQSSAFTWKATAQATLDVYRSVVGTHG